MAESLLEKGARQLTEQEKETLRRMFPDRRALDRASLILNDVGRGRLQDLSPKYFEELFLNSTSAQNLPRLGYRDHSDRVVGRLEESIPLCESSANGELSSLGPALLADSPSPRDGALVIRILISMTAEYLATRLRHDLSLMVVERTTSNEQMKRVVHLLDDYGMLLLFPRIGVRPFRV